MKVAFQMDCDVKVGSDLTVEFISEARYRGHEVFFFSPRSLSIINNIPVAIVNSIMIAEDKLLLGEGIKVELDDFDILFIRQNPPFDIRYLTTTYILENLKKTLLINDPKGIRDSPEKLFPLKFPKFIPETLVTENFSLVRDFYNHHKDIILKPLYSYGGFDVLRICKSNEYELNVIFDLMIFKNCSPIIVQKFCSNFNSDKRIVLLNGEPLGIIKRSIDPDNNTGDVRSNLRLGAIPKAEELSDRDKEICDVVGEELKARNLFFAAIDILDGYLLEINVTSPCGIIEMNKIYGVHLEKKCWDSFEAILNKKRNSKI